MALTPEQLEKDVKRLNERINEVVKLLGSGSEAYNRYVAKMKALLPSEYVRVDKDGLVKIARSKKLYKRAGDEKIERAFEQLLKVPTAGQIKAKAKRVIMSDRKKKAEEEAIKKSEDVTPDYVGVGNGAMVQKPTRQEVEEKARQIDRVEKFVTDNQEMFYVEYKNKKFNKLVHSKGKRTYDELDDLIKEYNKKKYKNITTIFSDLE